MSETQLAVMPTNPIELLSRALDKGVDADQLKAFVDLKREWEAGEARKAFFEAVARFKADPPKVLKDMENKQYGSRYASKGNLVNTVNAELSKHGLTANWSFEQRDTTIAVTCKLSHAFGHSESVTLAGPPDTSGSKNPLQQIKSTVTYLEIATFEAVTGVAASNDGDDDGGKSAERITDEQAANLTALLDETKANKKKFLEFVKVETLADIRAVDYPKAVKALEQKRKTA
jgi:hypothetical protein